METKEALDILKRHNIWRRGANIEPTNPERLGKAIDKAIEVLDSDVSNSGLDEPCGYATTAELMIMFGKSVDDALDIHNELEKIAKDEDV